MSKSFHGGFLLSVIACKEDIKCLHLEFIKMSDTKEIPLKKKQNMLLQDTRGFVTAESEAVNDIFQEIRIALRMHRCNKAKLVCLYFLFMDKSFRTQEFLILLVSLCSIL